MDLPADLWKIHSFFPSWITLFAKWSVTFNKATHETTFLPNQQKTAKTTQHSAQHHTAHTNPMVITTTTARGVNPPRRTAANVDQHATTTQRPNESKRKADADNENVETLHQKGESVDDNKNTKSPNRTKRKKSNIAIDGDNKKAPPKPNDNAKTAHETEALHAANDDKSGDQLTAGDDGKNNSRQTSKNNEGGALESSSDRNQSSTQGLTTPVKGTTVSKHGFSTLEKPVFFSLIMY